MMCYRRDAFGNANYLPTTGLGRGAGRLCHRRAAVPVVSVMRSTIHTVPVGVELFACGPLDGFGGDEAEGAAGSVVMGQR